MDIDLKNINMSDIKDQILKLADKKTLIKIGIISGAIIFFLIIYYAILKHPCVKGVVVLVYRPPVVINVQIVSVTLNI